MKTKRSILCGDRVRKLIKKNGYTQKRFAQEVMIMGEDYLYLILSGNRQLTDDQAMRIKEKFPDVCLEYLLGYSDIETVREWMEKNGAEAFRNAHDRFAAAETIIRTFGYEITDVPSSVDGSTLYEMKAPDGKVCVLKSEEYKNMIFSMFDDMRAKLLLTFQKAGAQDGEGR